MMIRKYTAFAAFLIFLSFSGVFAQNRIEFNLPDILGYKTLKCDLHTHTVFSDGLVWPTVRVDEVWRMGLDAVAITDHIEWTPFKKDFNLNYNRSYEIAKIRGDELDMLVIKGAEITRDMPPGHINALFLDDIEKLNTKDWRDAVKAAKEQNAFIFWNHPGWYWQLKPDNIVRWYDEHTELLNNGMLDGIEIVNQGEYYPDAHKWCIEKKLTIMSNTDTHDPAGTEYETFNKERRSFTVVFAKENTVESIKEALKEHRTIAYWNNNIAGDKKYLLELFNKSISFDKTSFEIRGKKSYYVKIRNSSGIDYVLVSAMSPEGFDSPRKITLYAGKTVLFRIYNKQDNLNETKDVVFPFILKNVFTEPEKCMGIEFKFKMKLLPAK